MRIVIIGPTKKENLWLFGRIKKNNLRKYISNTADILNKYADSIAIIPDNTLALEIAKEYSKGKKRVIGVIPTAKYSCKHIKKYFKFCDEFKKVDGGWSYLMTHLCLEGDAILCCGLSPGVLVELCYTKYHNKYIKKSCPILIDERTISKIPSEIKELNLLSFKSNRKLGELLKWLKKKN